jgi:Uma2 family endonuclease
MVTEARRGTMTKDRNRGRTLYRFTSAQVLKMIECGILGPDEDFELWNGAIYKLTKGELHNAIVSQIADLLRPLVPAGYTVREEKSCTAGPRHLPEPDIAVCQGTRFEFLPNPAPLERLALIVEVDHHSETADHVVKLAKYARAGVPVYWVVQAEERRVAVHERPSTTERSAQYQTMRTYLPGETIEVEIDGQPRGQISVSDLFPPVPRP